MFSKSGGKIIAFPKSERNAFPKKRPASDMLGHFCWAELWQASTGWQNILVKIQGSNSWFQEPYTPPKFNSSPLKSYLSKRKGSSSNHHFNFSGAMLNFGGVLNTNNSETQMLIISSFLTGESLLSSVFNINFLSPFDRDRHHSGVGEHPVHAKRMGFFVDGMDGKPDRKTHFFVAEHPSIALFWLPPPQAGC